MLKKLSINMNITSIKLIILTAIFWIAFANFSFFAALLNVYPLNAKNAPFLATLSFCFPAVIIIFLSLFCFRRTIKPILIVLLISSSLAAYFMDTYNILIDHLMISNSLETDTKEARDLLSATMFSYLILPGVIPAIFVYRANIIFQPFRREVITRIKLIVSLLVIVLGLFFLQSGATASFFREHKPIRYYSNPANYIFGMGRHVGNMWRSVQSEKPLSPIAEDAKIPETDMGRELIIMVVGETARADRFSLNGYKRRTNPLLEKQDVVSFSDVESCGTSTAISVPCMFSIDGADGFDKNEAKHKENALDVLKRVGVQVLWRDNNSSSKGVADRVVYQNYRDPEINTICDDECRDVGMLVGLQDYIDKQPEGDILIILHQMGNHGPAYYKRYPKEFEKFTPACQTNELGDCSTEEIDNAYDNAILYTDYFLNQVIELLKQNNKKFEVSMLYVSDHGESLGENNIYLHGMPNWLAPESQRHVPMIMWLGSNFDELSIDELRAKKNTPITHDNIFHVLLGLMEVESEVNKEDLDFISN